MGRLLINAGILLVIVGLAIILGERLGILTSVKCREHTEAHPVMDHRHKQSSMCIRHAELVRRNA